VRVCVVSAYVVLCDLKKLTARNTMLIEILFKYSVLKDL
jgi:hypothetical protein